MKSNKDFSGAIFLILLGIIFLLNTTGTVGWGIWTYILDYWPIVFVFWGIRLIIGNSLVAEIVLGVLSLIVYSSIGLLSYSAYTQKDLPFVPNYINEHFNRPLIKNSSGEYKEEKQLIEEKDFSNVENRNLDIKVGASKFSLTDDASSTNYLALFSKFNDGFIEPKLTSTMGEKDLNIEFRTVSSKRMFRFWNNVTSEFDLTLGKTGIPTNIDIDLGAGEGVVTLKEVKLGNVNGHVGAGQLTLSLLDKSVPNKILLEIGAANVDLTIPKNVGYSLEYDLGVGDISENNDSIASFISKETTYKSSNYEDAQTKIEIVTKVGAGSLNIYTK
ncbi:MAG: LiaF domain-containing protein [Candidatus Dojkabacteria bacterium]